jgi:glycosyltransferase involved in cell wall biosynthesis
MTKKRILFSVNVAWSMYNFRLGLIRALLKSGHDIIIVAQPDARSESLIAEGCRFEPINITAKGTNPLRDLKTFFDFFRIYRRVEPDIIFHYTIKPHIYGSIAAKILGIKNIAVTTGLGYAFIQDGLLARVARFLYKLGLLGADEVWFLNHDDEQVFRDQQIIGAKKTHILPSEGIDLDYFKPSENSKPTTKRDVRFLMISRMLWDKGVGEFIASAREILKEKKNVVFQLMGPVGAQNPSAISQDEVTQWVNEKTAVYLGEQKDVRPFIEAADCVVLPSYREGTGKVLLEAGAMKKPVIATRVPGCKTAVLDGVTGYLCEPKDSQSLTEAMNRFMNLPASERARMGESGRKFVKEKFSESDVIKIYEQTLERYLS